MCLCVILCFARPIWIGFDWMESEVHGPSQIGEADGTSADIRVGREGAEGGEE